MERGAAGAGVMCVGWGGCRETAAGKDEGARAGGGALGTRAGDVGCGGRRCIVSGFSCVGPGGCEAGRGGDGLGSARILRHHVRTPVVGSERRRQIPGSCAAVFDHPPHFRPPQLGHEPVSSLDDIQSARVRGQDFSKVLDIVALHIYYIYILT